METSIVKCSNCDKEMFKTITLDDDSVWLEQGSHNIFKYIASDEKLIICPHCTFKHETEECESEKGLKGIQIKRTC